MKKIIMIFFLSLSIFLTFGCSKDDKEAVNKEDLIDKEESIEEEEPVDKKEPEQEEANVPIDAEEEEEKEKIVYKNDLNGFSLELPSSWRGKYNVEREIWIDDESSSVAFNFEEDSISNNIFTIVIMEESFEEDEWEELFLIYIKEQDGKTFSYLNIMEPTEELLKEENKDKLEKVTEMVESVPEIIESFNIEK